VPVAKLTDRAVIVLAGPDAGKFLNGLVTQEVTGLGSGQARYAGLLSPQGKALFDMFVVGTPEGGLLLDIAAHRRADLLKRLTMYKLRADVSITPRDDLMVIAGWGAETPPELAWPDPRLPSMGWRLLSPDPATGTGDSLSDYHSHRISHGVPDSADIGVDQLLWLEANGDLLNGVSFTKGCYVGQENTARMHHRGKVRKRIVRVTSTEGLPETGTLILAKDKEAGSLLSVKGDQGLALLRLDFIESGAPLTANGEPVRVDLASASAKPPPDLPSAPR
jgi:tRNA-modifying protein YgfZ